MVALKAVYLVELTVVWRVAMTAEKKAAHWAEPTVGH